MDQISLSHSPHDRPLETRQTGQQPPPVGTCDFVQLLTFINTSQCYNTLVEDAFLSDNETAPGQLAEQYCTQACAGNFIDFVMNTWNCTASQKDIYRLIISRLCSQNNGRRCITYSLADFPFTGCELAATSSTPDSVCSADYRDSILFAVNEAGCCLALEISLLDSIGVPMIDNVLNTCDIQLPSACPLDYAAAASTSNISLSMFFVAIFVAIIVSY